jgi:glycosyltransferase involved in cell wall biosynthesis
MRVAIDATPLTLKTGGLARYTSELAEALAREFPEDDFYLISDQSFESDPKLKCGRAPSSWLSRRWWLWGAEREMRRIGAEVFHGTNFAVPYLPARPSVMTLHDLSPWMDPAWHHAAGRVRRRAPVLIGLRIATMILTDSEAVRRQAIERFRIHPARIAAVPLAASDRFCPVAGPEPERRYFLYVGALEPRKNLPFLVDAWRPVRDAYGVELALAGRAREDFAGLRPEPGLRILGETKEQELPALYSRALAFVYPSFYEGFGLPALEAMQCGACVIVSTDESLAEVTGDAGVKLDARDPKAWTGAMMACAAGGEWLREQRARSLARAREFSWARTARLTREVYEEARRRFHG